MPSRSYRLRFAGRSGRLAGQINGTSCRDRRLGKLLQVEAQNTDRHLPSIPHRARSAALPRPPDVRSVSDFPTSLPDSEQPLLWFARFESCVFAIHRFARS